MVSEESEKVLRNKLAEALMRVREHDSSVCKEIYNAIQQDPLANAALNKLEKDILLNTAKVRMPGLSAFELTKNVAARANNKLSKEDYLGAVGDYSAVIAIGLTSVIPLGGDATIEFLRATGVDLERSPIHNAYNTASGLNTYCKRLDHLAQAVLKPAEREEHTKTFLQLNLSNEQKEALSNLINKGIKAYQEERTNLGELPNPRKMSGSMPSKGKLQPTP